jgi:hypothetical protein
MLERTLAMHPDWLDGHKCLSSMRWTAGERENFARSYAAACQAQPHNIPLRMAWFYTVAMLRDWSAANQILDEGERIGNAANTITLGRLYVACESADQTPTSRAAAERLLAATELVRDAGVDICRMRYHLRSGQLIKAEEAGLRLIKASSARQAWPYLSLIWRLQGDARADWLDGAPPYIRTFELDFSSAEIAQLATLLRRLHTTSAPYIEQSVRGGTQTDRPLFFRHEPVVQSVRRKVIEAINEYISGMPAFEAGHPLLGTARAPIFFEGSWSVRLQAAGFHVSHTHPLGWISSALYVALPTTAQLGAAPAGWIAFGTPPSELELALQPFRQIEPKVGRLVLFPSTMWHSTVPFADGERLVVAFDVRLPRLGDRA